MLLVLRRWLGGGKFEPKSAALPWLRFNADTTAHSCDGFLNNGQADASSGVMIATVKTFKNTEDAVAMFWSDADAIVLHPDADGVAPFFLPDADLRGHSVGAEFDRIANQIADDLDQHGVVAENPVPGTFDLDAGFFFF